MMESVERPFGEPNGSRFTCSEPRSGEAVRRKRMLGGV